MQNPWHLETITLVLHSPSIHLDLKDRDGREVRVNSSDVQEDRDIWDLVYNGMLHSVIIGGAETNGMVHSALEVPRPAPSE